MWSIGWRNENTRIRKLQQVYQCNRHHTTGTISYCIFQCVTYNILCGKMKTHITEMEEKMSELRSKIFDISSSTKEISADLAENRQVCQSHLWMNNIYQ